MDRSGASQGRIVAGVVVLVAGAVPGPLEQDGDTQDIPSWASAQSLDHRGDHDRAGARGPQHPGVRRRCASPQGASPASWPPRTRPAARSEPRPPHPHSSSAWRSSASSRCSRASAKASIDGGGEPRVLGDFVVQSEAGVRRSGLPGYGRRGRSTGSTASTWWRPSGFGGAQVTYPDGKEADELLTSIDPGSLTRSSTPRWSRARSPTSTDDGVIVDQRERRTTTSRSATDHRHRRRRRQRRARPWRRISDDPNLLGVFTITRETSADVMPQLLDIQVFGTVDEGADLDAVLAEIEKPSSETPALRGARPRGLHRLHRPTRSPRS